MTARVALAIASATAVAALSDTGATAPREGLIAFEANWSIKLVEPDGSGLRVLAEKGERSPREGDGLLFYPSFTRDGLRVTYVNGARTTHQDVLVRRVAGGGTKLFGVDGYLLASPLSFSPGSRFAVVSRFRDRPGELALFVAATPAGREDIQLTSDPPPRRLTKDTRPDWSPDGRSVAFARLQRTKALLMVVPAFGGPARRLIPGAEPDWAPSGKSIVFVRRDGVYVCRRDGTGVRKIVSAAGAASPDFAPDGTRLAYAAAGSVWVVSSSGGIPVKIADGVTGDLDWG